MLANQKPTSVTALALLSVKALLKLEKEMYGVN